MRDSGCGSYLIYSGGLEELMPRYCRFQMPGRLLVNFPQKNGRFGQLSESCYNHFRTVIYAHK